MASIDVKRVEGGVAVGKLGLFRCGMEREPFYGGDIGGSLALGLCCGGGSHDRVRFVTLVYLRSKLCFHGIEAWGGSWYGLE